MPASSGGSLRSTATRSGVGCRQRHVCHMPTLPPGPTAMGRWLPIASGRFRPKSASHASGDHCGSGFTREHGRSPCHPPRCLASRVNPLPQSSRQPRKMSKSSTFAMAALGRKRSFAIRRHNIRQHPTRASPPGQLISISYANPAGRKLTAGRENDNWPSR